MPAATPVAPRRPPENPALVPSDSAPLRISPWQRLAQTPLLNRCGPYAALLLFALALLWPLCLGRSLYWGDIMLYFDVMLRYAQERLRQGQLPLWNPYVLCGQPYIGNPQSSVFYPTTLALPFLPVWLYLSLNSLLHLFLCGAFAYLFLRRWTTRPLSALAGAFVYMGSACLLGRLQFPPMLQTAPYFPLVLMLIDACMDAPGPVPALKLAAAVGLTLLAGHPQMAYLIFLCSALYGLARLWATSRQAKRRRGGEAVSVRSAWRCLLAAGALGLLSASAQLLPALQLLRESPREEMTAFQANRFVLEPAQLLTLIAPRFFGHPASGDYWGGGNAWEPALFVGWLPLLLIGYAAWRCRREGRVRFWGAVAVLSLWLALGVNGGLYWLAFWLVPGVSKFHDPARFLFITTLAFAMLTAVGTEALRIRHWQTGLPFVLGLIVPLWWYGQDWNPTVPPDQMAIRPARARQLRAETGSGTSEAGRLYHPFYDLYSRRYISDGYRDYGPYDPRAVTAMFNTLMLNLNMRLGLEAAFGYEPVAVAAPVQVEGLTRQALKRGEPNLPTLFRLLNVRTLLLPVGVRLTDTRLQQVGAPMDGLQLWRNQDRPPRAWLVRRVRHIEGAMRISAALTASDFSPGELAILSGASDANAAMPQGRRGYPFWLDSTWPTEASETPPAAPVTLTEWRPEAVTMRADCGPSPAFLVYSGAAYPGWKASVDGASTRLFRANGALMGVAVPPGKHRVRLTYMPEVFRVGVYLSLLACGALAAGVGVAVSSQAKRRRNG